MKTYGIIPSRFGSSRFPGKPLVVLAGKPDWLPKNSGGGYSGVITIRTALQRSLNTVSAQILDKLTPRTSFDFLREKLGVTSLVDADCDYAPLALGQLTNGITVREMAQAYSAFVNDGVFTYSRTYSYVTDSEGNVVLENPARTITAFQPNTAWNMADMLYNAVNAGTGSEARLSNMPVGGKTGTTSDNYDRWFVGFTPYYVAAVWTGYDMPEAMNFSGNPASQIWRLVMAPIHENLPYKDFPTPDVGQPTGIFGTFYVPPPEPVTPDPPAGGDPARLARRRKRADWLKSLPEPDPLEKNIDYGRPLMACGTEEKLRETLRSLRTPTLILGGTEDPISTPALMTRTACCLPHCKLVMYSGCGHNIDTDFPEELAEEADRFLASLAKPLP